jgi:malate dehydrogenase
LKALYSIFIESKKMSSTQSGHHNQKGINKVLENERSLAPVKVLITGALGQIAYSLIFLITRGEMFGSTRRVILHLLDVVGVPDVANKFEALRMEIEDTASDLVAGVLTTTDYAEAFNDIDVALLVGARPRGPGMERKDLLAANESIFRGQGEAIDTFAKKSVLVLVVGNPANTNALIAATYAPTIDKRQFACLTRLDQNRAQALLASKCSEQLQLQNASISPANIHGVIIWGNHSSTQYPDARFAMINAYPREQDTSSVRTILSAVTSQLSNVPNAQSTTSSSSSSFNQSITDSLMVPWLQSDFIHAIQQRGKIVIEKRGLSSAASAASAIVDCMRDWWCGSNGRMVSMGVFTTDSKETPGFDATSYKVPKDLFFSLPVVCEGKGKLELVSDLTIDAFSASKIAESLDELIEEKKLALG